MRLHSAKFVAYFDALVRACLNRVVQYLVFVHNLASGQQAAQAMIGDAPVVPVPDEALSAYARIWIDALEPDPAGAIARTIDEALEWPREHGESVVHMTATTSLELELGPNFDSAKAVTKALQATLAAANLRLPPSWSKSA